MLSTNWVKDSSMAQRREGSITCLAANGSATKLRLLLRRGEKHLVAELTIDEWRELVADTAAKLDEKLGEK